MPPFYHASVGNKHSLKLLMIKSDYTIMHNNFLQQYNFVFLWIRVLILHQIIENKREHLGQNNSKLLYFLEESRVQPDMGSI